jgi:hypothetical protein
MVCPINCKKNHLVREKVQQRNREIQLETSVSTYLSTTLDTSNPQTAPTSTLQPKPITKRRKRKKRKGFELKPKNNYYSLPTL